MFGKKKADATIHVVERCASCGMEAERGFRKGDCVFARAAACPSCGGDLTIDRIFGRTS